MREHGVGARHLEQAGRQAVAIGHGGLLDRTPGLVGAQAAGDRAGETAIAASGPKPRPNLPHLARGICMAILVVPTLLDFWITPDGERAMRVRVEMVGR